MVNIIVTQDNHGYIASVEGSDNLFARGANPEEAKKELVHVVDMMLDLHLEQVEKERNIKNYLLKEQAPHAL